MPEPADLGPPCPPGGLIKRTPSTPCTNVSRRRKQSIQVHTAVAVLGMTGPIRPEAASEHLAARVRGHRSIEN